MTNAGDDAFATIRISHGDGLRVAFEKARIVGIRGGQIGIVTQETGPTTTDGDLWTQSVLEYTIWLDLADIVSLDVGADPDTGLDAEPTPGLPLSPTDKDAVEARLRPFLTHAVNGLLRPEERDGSDALRPWWSFDSQGYDVLRVSVAARGERFECPLWAAYAVDSEGLDSFCDQLEDFISESRFAWGQQRLLTDRPWHAPGHAPRSMNEPG